jgi:integrase/recombinase XerD
MSSPSGVRMSGPLLVFTSGFREDLARRGCRPGTAAKQLQLMAHISRWLTGGGLEAGDVTTARVEQFLTGAARLRALAARVAAGAQPDA